MMAADFIFRGILIGLIFGMPVGAVGAMTIQRTWEHGIRAGLVTGLGSSVADCIYACIGAFGLTMISDILLKYQTMIHLLGGCLILMVGIRLLRVKTERTKENDTARGKGRMAMFLSSFAVGITNPAAILTFLFAFSWFGVTGEYGAVKSLSVVLGVFFGTYFWWGALSGAVELAKKKGKLRDFQHMNRIFGAILSLFGFGIFIKAVI